MDRDKTLKDMAELLLSKARMLQYHCGKCKSPLFEKDEKVICPVCGELQLEEGGKGEPLATAQKPDTKTAKILIKKRDELLAQIEKEKNPKKLTGLLEALEKINKSL